MDAIFSVLGFLIISIFWILAFFKLYNQSSGIYYFFKHFIPCLLVCFFISILIGLIAINQSVGLEVIVYMMGILLIDAIIYFIWSIVLFTLAIKREKEALQKRGKEGYEDILDDMVT